MEKQRLRQCSRDCGVLVADTLSFFFMVLMRMVMIYGPEANKVC